MFVFPSLREGLSRALMEAMATGLPVVCSDIRGNVDLIADGKGGFVVPNEPNRMAEAIRKLAEDPALRAAMGAYNMQAVEAFREEKSLKAVERLLKVTIS